MRNKTIIKSTALLLVVIITLSFSGCTKNNASNDTLYSEYEVVLNSSNSSSVSSAVGKETQKYIYYVGGSDSENSAADNTSAQTSAVSSEDASTTTSKTSILQSFDSSVASPVSSASSVVSSASSKEEGGSSATEHINPSIKDATANYRDNWNLTFNDDFNGTSLDLSKWSYTPEWKRDTCYWKRDAVSVRDGNLILSVINTYEGYHAGAIRTINTFKQAYGYYEVRCKAPTTSGINNAFWLMGGSMNTRDVTGGYDGAEIDIFETYDYKNKYFQNAIHWDGYGEYHAMDQQYVNKINIYDGKFHTFGFAWTRSEYIFYVDGFETWRTTAGGVCQVPLYMKLTTCTGGWVGNPDPSKIPTEAMVVDYVRVYSDPDLK